MYRALWRGGKARETADPSQAAEWLESGAVLERQEGDYRVVARSRGRRGYHIRLYRKKGKPIEFPARATAEATVAAMNLGGRRTGECGE